MSRLRTFKWSRLALAVSISLGMVAQAGPNAGSQSSNARIEKAYREVLQSGRGSFYFDLANEVASGRIRHPVDAAVYNTLTQDPLGAVVMSELLPQLSTMLDQQVAQFTSNFALAMAGKYPQYQQKLAEIKEVARIEGFSSDAIKNLKLYVVGDATVNAFTISAFQDRIVVVIYEGLLTKINSAEFKAVVAHELGHIRAQHVLTGSAVEAVMIQALLYNLKKQVTAEVAKAKGGDAQKALEMMELQREIESQVRANIGTSIMHSHAATGHSDKVEEMIGRLTHGFMASLNHMSDSRRVRKAATVSAANAQSTVPPGMTQEEAATGEAFTSLAQRLAIIIQGQPINFDNPNFMETLQNLQGLLVKATRSQETSADRWAIVTMGADPVTEAMAKLAGGLGANGKAIKAQVNALLESMPLQSLLNSSLDQNDHPNTGDRAVGYQNFTSQMAYEIFSNPFLKTVYMYLEVSRNLTDINDSLSTEIGDLSPTQRGVLLKDEFKKMAQGLSQIIISELKKEAQEATAATGAPYFEGMIGLFDKLRSSRVPDTRLSDTEKQIIQDQQTLNNALLDNAQLGKDGRLMFDLVRELSSVSSPLAQFEISEIQKRFEIESNGFKSGLRAVLAQGSTSEQTSSGVSCQVLFREK